MWLPLLEEQHQQLQEQDTYARSSLGVALLEFLSSTSSGSELGVVHDHAHAHADAHELHVVGLLAIVALC